MPGSGRVGIAWKYARGWGCGMTLVFVEGLILREVCGQRGVL